MHIVRCDVAVRTETAAWLSHHCTPDALCHAGGALQVRWRCMLQSLSLASAAPQLPIAAGMCVQLGRCYCAVQDALLAKQTAASMRAACAPKLAGAAALQQYAAAKPVRAWGLFSSIAGLIGSSGQANYAAANATLDTWTATLHSQVCAKAEHCK